MISRIQVLNYRCLQYVDIPLERFHVLVGANASGKSTLFDVVAFLSDLMRDGLEVAVEKRTRNFQDLVWGRPEKNPRFELGVEFDVPENIAKLLPSEKNFQIFRYEIAISLGDEGLRIESERGILISGQRAEQQRRENGRTQQKEMFPDPKPGSTIMTQGGRPGARTILSKSPEGRDNFNAEVSEQSGKGWVVNISFGSQRSTLKNLPESTEQFPMASYVKRTLESGVNAVFLDSPRMRQPSPPHRRHKGFATDGSNLPWSIMRLQDTDKADYSEWLAHIQTTLRDLESIRVVERPEDRHAYLVLRYKTGLEVPSWMVSDGTLRFLALTLLAYLPNSNEVYVLEEPENGVHPMAIDAVFDSLRSVYDSQVLVATHSPVFLKRAEPEDVLCFAKDKNGATDIVRGNHHPLLRNWQGTVDMDILFATGVFR